MHTLTTTARDTHLTQLVAAPGGVQEGAERRGIMLFAVTAMRSSWTPWRGASIYHRRALAHVGPLAGAL